MALFAEPRLSGDCAAVCASTMNSPGRCLSGGVRELKKARGGMRRTRLPIVAYLGDKGKLWPRARAIKSGRKRPVLWLNSSKNNKHIELRLSSPIMPVAQQTLECLLEVVENPAYP